MKLFIIICFISSTKGASLPSISALIKSELEFIITKDDNSVVVKAVVKHLPDSLDILDYVNFYLFTENNTQGLNLQLKDKALLNSQFNFNQKTKILIHGFANSISSDFITTLQNSYMEEHTYNVIVVDWSQLCRPPFYVSAVANAQQVGARLAQLIRRLHAQGVNMSDVHLLGHSIGAHIAGITGYQLRDLPPLGRITGLDPAKPMFEQEDDSNLLSADDASFVDCIHTCGGFLGVWEPRCSADFYPNGGTNPQPGCRFDIFGVCSHQRAFKYFSESIKGTSMFQSVQCEAVKNYSPVNCSNEATAVMGERVDLKSRGVYYVGTISQIPFTADSSPKPVSTVVQFMWYFK